MKDEDTLYKSRFLHVNKGELYGRGPKDLVYLEHSCNEWLIGGKIEVAQMIKDLQEMYARLERNERIPIK